MNDQEPRITPNTPVGTPVRCRWTGDRLTIVEHLPSGLVRLSDGSIGEYGQLAPR